MPSVLLTRFVFFSPWITTFIEIPEMQFFAQKRNPAFTLRAAVCQLCFNFLCIFRKCKRFHHGSWTTHFRTDHCEVGCIESRP